MLQPLSENDGWLFYNSFFYCFTAKLLFYELHGAFNLLGRNWIPRQEAVQSDDNADNTS